MDLSFMPLRFDSNHFSCGFLYYIDAGVAPENLQTSRDKTGQDECMATA